MSQPACSTLHELVELLREGEHFYLDAACKVQAPVYRNLFLRMARIKGAIAAELASYIASHDDSSVSGRNTLDRLREMYAATPVGVGRIAEKIYLTLLEETEDRILQDFRRHVRQDASTVVRILLTRRLPEAQKAHDDMLDLKTRLDHPIRLAA